MSWKRGALLLVPGALLLAACGAAGGAQPAPAAISETQFKPSAPQQEVQCEAGKEAWRTQGAPKRGGTLVRASLPFDNFDITKPGTTTLYLGAAQVNQTLVELRGCHYEDIAMMPSLAKSWQMSPDGRTWTLSLRNDVKWHNKPPVNGRPFTSADVAWTIELQKREGILRATWQDVEHQEPDAHTVILRLKEPDADFILRMGSQLNVMLAREVKEQFGDFKSVAIGTGAYMVKDFKQAQELWLEPNPGYYEQGADGKPLPYLEGVRTLPFSDVAAQVAALRSGQLDISSYNGVEKGDAEALRTANTKLRIYEQIVFSTISLWFDVTKKPLDDPRVRKALAMAINPDDLIARYQGGGVRSGFVPAFLKDYAWSQEKLREKFKPQLEQAKKLLAEAGFPADQRLPIKTGSFFQQDAEVIQKHLEAIGVNTTIDVEGTAFGTLFSKGEFLMGFGPITGVTYPSYWVGDLVRSGAAPRFLRTGDAQIDSLAAAAAREVDPGKRKQTIDQLQDRLYEVMPYVPVASRLYYHVLSCRTKNARLINPAYNSRTAVEAWLDPSGC